MNQLKSFDLQRKEEEDEEIPSSANIDLTDSEQVGKYVKQMRVEKKVKNAIFIILLEEQQTINSVEEML